MPEDRMTVAEHRLDDVEGVAARASRLAESALTAHRYNIRMLNALAETQAEHSARFDRIDQRLDRVDQRLDRVDQRLDRVDQRLDEVGGSLGRLTAGMHTIESLLRRVVDDA
jgi:ABC-type transporter Mla subunit MlaD